jgi:MerR family regulatory protein
MRTHTADLKDTYLMQPGQVAKVFDVDVKTVTKWALRGKLHPAPTPGGHRRYYLGEVRAVLAGKTLSVQKLEELRQQALREAMQS